MKKMIIIRGIPGSGKTTMANRIAEELRSAGNATRICSADLFFGDTPEEYRRNWTKEKIQEAHTWCREQARQGIEANEVVIIDNTNSRRSEYAAYLELAEKAAYEVEIVEPDTPLWRKAKMAIYKKNRRLMEEVAEEATRATVHGVPKHTIMNMLARFET